MLWHKPDKVVEDVSKVQSYTIRPGSTLDAPRYITLKGTQFEDALTEYFNKQLGDPEFILAMVPIYDIIRKEGAVIVLSCCNKFLKARHEKVVVDLIKNNLQHLMQLNHLLR